MVNNDYFFEIREPQSREWGRLEVGMVGLGVALLAIAGLSALFVHYQGGIVHGDLTGALLGGAIAGGSVGGVAFLAIGLSAHYSKRAPYHEDNPYGYRPNKQLVLRKKDPKNIFPSARVPFPIDLFNEVLSCLDFSTVLKVQLVCKLWYTLISQSDQLWAQRSLSNTPARGLSWKEKVIRESILIKSGRLFAGKPASSDKITIGYPISEIVAPKGSGALILGNVDSYEFLGIEMTIPVNKKSHFSISGDNLVVIEDPHTLKIEDLERGVVNTIVDDKVEFTAVTQYDGKIYLGTKVKKDLYSGKYSTTIPSVNCYSQSGVLEKQFPVRGQDISIIHADARGILIFQDKMVTLLDFDSKEISSEEFNFPIETAFINRDWGALNKNDYLILSRGVWRLNRVDTPTIDNFVPAALQGDALLCIKDHQLIVYNLREKRKVTKIDAGAMISAAAMRDNEIYAATAGDNLTIYRWGTNER